MAVELTAVLPQTVQPGQNVLFSETPIPCAKGYVIHRKGAGIVTLRGINCQQKTRYKVTFGGNISIPTGTTISPISVAFAIGGEPLPSTTMTVTPTAVENAFNVSRPKIIDVPYGCCVTIAVENVSVAAGATPAPAIVVENANLTVERVA